MMTTAQIQCGIVSAGVMVLLAQLQFLSNKPLDTKIIYLYVLLSPQDSHHRSMLHTIVEMTLK
jgi:hypothetical protein